MFRSIVIASAALAIVFGAGAASAQKIDANGRCHDAAGRFAKAEVCGGVSAKGSKTAKAATAAGVPAAATATATAKGSTPAKPARCKDAKGKFAKCGTPGAKPA